MVDTTDNVGFAIGAACGGEYSQSKNHSTLPIPVVDGLQCICTSIGLFVFQSCGISNDPDNLSSVPAPSNEYNCLIMPPIVCVTESGAVAPAAGKT